jgi:16S rRNA G966 N2-methylase RsmD
MDRRVLDRLRRNVEALGVADSSIIWPGDVTRGLARRLDDLGEKLDLAFVDPPYADLRQWDWSEAEAALFAPLAAHLAPDGVVVLRMPDDAAGPRGAGEPFTIAGLVCRREKRFGNMVLALMGLEKKTTEPE